jgi:hypothetical protein
MFTAGGCAECHAAPVKGCDDLNTEDKEVLAGGRCLKTSFGTFHVPNISPDQETGIGKWSTIDFVNAMKRGIAPDGSYLYPAFPYTSYQRMTYEDLIDLKACLDSLPAAKSEIPRTRSDSPSTSAAGSVFGTNFMSTVRASRPISKRAPRSIAAATWCGDRVIAPSVTPRAT